MANRPRTRSRTLSDRLSNQVSDRLSDPLSELPLSIIHEILGHVPMRTAVSTCVLSRRWRHTWTTLPCLIFTSGEEGEYELMETFDKSTEKFISNALLHHNGPIERFALSCSCSSVIEKWLLRLSNSGVRELILGIHWDKESGGAGSLKSSIYKCAELTQLNVAGYKMNPPPSTFKGFLFLESMFLVGVVLSSDGFESLVGNCPVLEILAVVNCAINELRIRSPNLKRLLIYGSDYRKISLHAPLLCRISVDLREWGGPYDIPNTVCNYTDLLGNSTNLVELRGDHFFTQLLSDGLESCHSTLVFHHLTVIELRGVGFYDLKQISAVARLIRGAPNLNKVYFETLLLHGAHGDGAPDVSFREYFRFARSFTLEKLKDVTLSFVCHYPTGMQFLKFLLETSPVLETMELELAGRSRLDRVSAEVLGFDKASPNAKVTITNVADV